MMKSETIIISKPTYVELIEEVDRYGAQGFEPFHFERDIPSQSGTALAMFMRRITVDETALAAVPAAQPPAPDPNMIPDPGAKLNPTPATAPAAQPPASIVHVQDDDVPHPLVQAGLPPRLVSEVDVVARLEGRSPKDLVMQAVTSYVMIAWEKLEQDGKVTIGPDGNRRINE